MTNDTIAALQPRGRGHRFVLYGDCCSGIPGRPFEANFARVNAALQRLQPPPEFVVFLGDHIMGGYTEDADLTDQWRYWLDHEMAWLDMEATPVYHLTSNHNTLDRASEELFRQVFPDMPRNGAPGQQGLSYFIERDDLLLVVVHTSCSALGGPGHVESAWLDAVLTAHGATRHKIVAGHHPVFPVNGYAERPQWCIDQHEAEAFWRVLVKHGVLAYLCSHVIAFDAQAHDGVLQVCSGGAGTNYGPGGFMGDGEYHHFVQAALDEQGLRLQAVDDAGRVRETLSHPLGA